MTIAESVPGAQTALRAVALLKAFTDDRPELGLADLARLVGLNRTTAYRLLSALESEGMVARSASGAYRLGPQAIALGGRALRSNDLRSAAHAELERLAEETGETATLEVLVGNEVLILDEVAGNHMLGVSQSIGTRWPAHATSTGKAILAHLSAPERKAALRGPQSRLTPRTTASRAALNKELALTRNRGYATALDELELGYTAVGAPVQNFHGQVVAAISIGGPTIRLTEKRVPEVAARVMEAAKRISRRLGLNS